MPELLSTSEIQERSAKLPNWKCDQKQIERTWKFRNFAEALQFVNRVAELAEAANHHPDIDIRWNQVRLVLSTHSKGGLTENDFAMAGKIERLGG